MKTFISAALFLTVASSCTDNTNEVLDSVGREPVSIQGVFSKWNSGAGERYEAFAALRNEYMEAFYDDGRTVPDKEMWDIAWLSLELGYPALLYDACQLELSRLRLSVSSEGLEKARDFRTKHWQRFASVSWPSEGALVPLFFEPQPFDSGEEFNPWNLLSAIPRLRELGYERHAYAQDYPTHLDWTFGPYAVGMERMSFWASELAVAFAIEHEPRKADNHESRINENVITHFAMHGDRFHEVEYAALRARTGDVREALDALHRAGIKRNLTAAWKLEQFYRQPSVHTLLGTRAFAQQPEESLPRDLLEIDKFKDEALGWAWNRIANEGHYTGDGSHNNSDGFGPRISPALRPTADIIYSNLTAQSEAENQASIQKRRRWSNLQRKQQAAILEYSFTERAHREGAQTE